MGFGAKQGFTIKTIRANDPTFVLKGGGGKVAKAPALNTPTFTLS